ncbi:MAG: hypothetical protein WCO05_01615 [Candidatus Moraniibacteriota bacterium]
MLIIIAVTVFGVLWKYEKSQKVKDAQIQNVSAKSRLNSQGEKKGVAEKIKTNSESSFVENTYTNSKYNFQITIPKYWQIIEDDTDNGSDPAFVFYKYVASTNGEKVTSAGLFTEGTFVVVRPHGQASEGISGKTLPAKLKGLKDANIASDYVLKNGTSWATFVKFKRIPNSWEESGFIFGRNTIKDEKITCERNDKIIDREKCDLWGGDILAYNGSVSELDRKQIEKIVSTFEFVF